MNSTLLAIITLGSLAVLAAIFLYAAKTFFKVEEDTCIDEVEALLPGANCGGCGQVGCRQFAEACVKSAALDSLYCPVGGAQTMKAVADKLGREVISRERTIAVLRCQVTPANRPQTSQYDGASSCMIASLTYGGQTGCTWGCLGLADCVEVCQFKALQMNLKTGLPEVDEDACTACGACIKACPKNLFELRKQGPHSKRIYVACMNQDRGALAGKECRAACIGCGKCLTACSYDGISMTHNLAYMLDDACRLCRKCVEVCPTGSILECHFPPRKSVQDAPETLQLRNA
jgi:Na+-translocating ferredoxin:NAD+ oxidoreductase RNF subunit RnfB